MFQVKPTDVLAAAHFLDKVHPPPTVRGSIKMLRQPGTDPQRAVDDRRRQPSDIGTPRQRRGISFRRLLIGQLRQIGRHPAGGLPPASFPARGPSRLCLAPSFAVHRETGFWWRRSFVLRPVCRLPLPGDGRLFSRKGRTTTAPREKPPMFKLLLAGHALKRR